MTLPPRSVTLLPSRQASRGRAFDEYSRRQQRARQRGGRDNRKADARGSIRIRALRGEYLVMLAMAYVVPVVFALDSQYGLPARPRC